MLVNMHTKKITLDKCVAKEKISKWIEQDIIVPDSKPDAVKIANVTVTPYVNDIEVMDGKIKVVGKINYFVIYLVNDEKFNTRGLFVSYPYTEVLNVDNLKANMNVTVESKCKNVIYSLPNERKISIKSEIIFDVIVKDNICVDIIESFDEDSNIECKMKKKTFNNIIQNKSNIIASKEDIMLPKEAEDFVEILKLDTKIINTEYKESYNKIMVKGDIDTNLLFLADNPNENIKKLNFTIPFSAMIEVNGINDKSKFEVKYKMRDFDIKLNEDITSTKTMNAQYQIDVDVVMYEEEELEYVDDFYSQLKELKYENNIIEAISQNVKLKENLEVKENLTNIIPMNNTILNYSLDTSNLNANINNGIVEIEGNAKIYLLLQDMSNMEIENKIIDILIDEKINLDNIGKDIKGHVEIENENLYVTQNGNDLEVKIVLDIETIIENIVKMNMISKIEEKELDLENIDSINIYIVKPGDTLWKIAKKYKTSIDKIVKSNDIINPNEINVGQKLLIIR